MTNRQLEAAGVYKSTWGKYQYDVEGVPDLVTIHLSPSTSIKEVYEAIYNAGFEKGIEEGKNIVRRNFKKLLEEE